MPTGPQASGTTTIKFEENVPKEQQQILQDDLTVTLPNLQPVSDDKNLKKLLGISEVTSASLTGWLEERVHYVVGETFDIQTPGTLYVVEKDQKYPNVIEKPKAETPKTETPQGDAPAATAPVDPATGSNSSGNTQPEPEKDESIKLLMANMGALVYAIGKSGSIALGVDLAGIGKVPVKSPRVGLLQIGGALLLPIAGENGPGITAEVSSLNRLKTLFHEARHSDGNGKSLAFFHAKCPSGPYKGISACDRNLNGPYTVGAYIQRNFAKACVSCTTQEREFLLLSAVDSFSRVIKKTYVAKSVEDLLAGKIECIPSTDWDTTPESL